MNFILVLNIIGHVLKYEAIFMSVPLLFSIYYRDGDAKAFLITIILLAIVSFFLLRMKPSHNRLHAREGFVAVALSWVVLSLFGALPFYFCGYFASFVDCFFEAISGFTTTGATILQDVEILPHGILFWRSFTHWIGGMGVLVFVLAIIPSINPSAVYLLKAESPGPSPSKFVPKIKETARILYLIYFGMTVIHILLLLLVKMPFFDSLIHVMGSAGTGGFSSKNLSVGAYNNVPAEMIIAVFMFLFGINFNIYYFLLKKEWKKMFLDEELRLYFIIVLVAIGVIAINIFFVMGYTPLTALRYASFQVSSIITTTGYGTTDFNLWPSLSKSILVVLTVIGACAGSTGGAMKISRILILTKTIKRELGKTLHPRVVSSIKVNGKTVEESFLVGVLLFFFVYVMLAVAVVLLISIENHDLISSGTAVLATLGNVGPGLGIVGPVGNYSYFTPFSKLVLSFCMLAGRLELIPMLILLRPSTWKKSD